LQQVSGFLLVPWFPPPLKLTASDILSYQKSYPHDVPVVENVMKDKKKLNL
jgi:hypothetical protein